MTTNSSPCSVASSNVKDKIGAILICQNVPGTASAKFGRTGEKYLATQKLSHDLAALIRIGVKYKATGKVDGTCALITNGAIRKRRDIKPPEGKKKQVIPEGWIQTGIERTPGHLIGFMPLDKGDKWHLDCHVKTPTGYDMKMINVLDLNDARTGLVYKQVAVESLDSHTIEVMGPKFQSNPHHLKMHCIMRHGLIELSEFPDLGEFLTGEGQADAIGSELSDSKCTGDALSAFKHWFTHSPQGPYLEGVVLHFENGQMFKIHRHHLDLEWSADATLPLDQIPL